MTDFDNIYKKLNKLIHYLAYSYSISTSEILMEYDEIVGELYIELWKGYKYYTAKELEGNKLVAVLNVMLNNRIKELQYRYFVTHRKYAQTNLSLDFTFDDVDNNEYQPVICNTLIDNVPQNPLDKLLADEKLECCREMLDDNVRDVFDAVVYGHEQLALLVWLSGLRAKKNFRNPGTVKMKPRHVAAALHISVKEAKKSLSIIRETVEVFYG